MEGHDLAPSRSAAALLELLTDRASVGALGVDVGGRTVVLSEGAVVDVEAARDDEPFGEFLIQAGRLSRATLAEAAAEAEAERLPLEQVLLARELIGARALADARRAMWLERLARGLAASSNDDGPPKLCELAETPRPGAQRVALLPLVLDALARQADERDAEVVGAHTDRLFALREGPHEDRVARWLDIGDLSRPITVAQLLLRSPGSARRLAAALRAGVADLGPAIEGRVSTLPPPRAPELVLAPGSAPEAAELPDLTPRLSRFPSFVAKILDPLAPLEARLRTLEAEGAEGPRRAEIAKQIASTWQGHYGCITEATRAWREAVAADPHDLEALDQAAVRCAAIGRLDLARAYADAAAAEVESRESTPRERANAFLKAARLALREGDLDGCLSNAKLAAEADPGASEAHELALLALRGDDRAVRHAVRAAERALVWHPDRARALLAWAQREDPDDPTLLSRYADAAIADGFVEAGVALLAAESRRTDNPDLARALRLEAAERAEAAERPDLAAELLLEAFDAEPHVDVLYEPVVADLSASGALLRLAIVLEDIASVCPHEDRAQWLTRAADAHRALPGEPSHAVELYTHALEADPSAAAPIEALRAIAEESSDPTLLADAFERVLRRAAAAAEDDQAIADVLPDAKRDLLLALASLAEERLGSPHRAAWAWAELEPLLPDPSATRAHLDQMRSKLRVSEDLVAMAERDLDAAAAEERPRAARKLAALLRDHPEHRERVLALYREAAAADPDEDVGWSAIERLTWILGRDEAMASLLRERVARASSRGERLRLLSRLAGLEQLCGDHESAISACLAILEIAPQHEEALARLHRAARHIDDRELVREVLLRRAHHADGVRERARVLSMLARACEETGDREGAARYAREAIAADPAGAEAALVLARTVGALEDVRGDPGDRAPSDPAAVLEALRALREALGLSAPLAAAIAAAAESAGDLAARNEAIEAWSKLLPSDPEPALARVRACIEGDDAAALRTSLEHLLGTERVGEEDARADAIERALDRLEELAGPAETSRLALHAVDCAGRREPGLLDRAVRIAEAARMPRQLVAALERVVAFADGSERVEPLVRIADLHAQQGDRGAEARTLLRVLEVDPHHEEVLSRLTTLYAEAGDGERLTAVLALRLEAAGDPATRRERKLDLAAAALHIAGDRSKAERLVRELAEDDGDADAVAAAASAVAAIGSANEAVAILTERAKGMPPAEAGPLLERAVALASNQGDRELALSVATEGLAQAPAHGPLLLQFEHLALELGAVATAKKTYETLAERAMGPHGRRAFLYREARWLEKAGEPAGALDCYARAFALAPSLGVVFGSIERLARALGRWQPLVDACLTMAERMPHPDRRMELMRRAAATLEHELDDPARAFEVLDEAWRTLGGTEVYAELRRIARGLSARDAARGDAALDTLVARLRTRAEKSWDDEDRAGALMQAAELRAVDAREPDAAAAIVDETLALDLPASTHAHNLCRLARWLLDTNRIDDAIARAKQAELLDGANDEARALSGELRERKAAVEREPPAPRDTIETLDTREPVLPEHHSREEREPERERVEERAETESREQRSTLREPVAGRAQAESREQRSTLREPAASQAQEATRQTRDTVRETAPLDDELGDLRDVVGEVIGDGAVALTERFSLPDAAAGAPSTDAPFRASVPPGPEEEPLRIALAEGDLDAAESLAARIATDAMRLREALDLLLWLLRRDPSRVGALRRLHRIAVDLEATAVADVSAEVLSLFEPGMTVPAPDVLLRCNSFLERASAIDVDSRLLAWISILRLVWEGAMPLYKQTLSDFGVVGTDRITALTASPVGRAWADAVRVLGLDEVPLYLKGGTADPVFPARTQPPSVIAGAGAENAAPVALRFRLGRALELARPEHVLLATLPEREGALLVEAVVAAFGDAALASQSSREAVAMAATLWNTIPGRAQQRIRALLEGIDEPPDYRTLRSAVMSAAARSGAMVAGQVRASVEALLIDDPDIGSSRLDSEDAYRDACRASAPLAGLVQFALSDTYLAARARAMRA